tara:strand:- start:126 stop:446 length:321 start_codon:yes stop_codon:yes gene_type:complete
MSISRAVSQFTFDEIEIIDELNPDTACTAEHFISEYGMESKWLFGVFKVLLERGIVDWSGIQKGDKKRMPHYMKFPKTKFFMTPLGRTLFNDNHFKNDAYLHAYST